MPIRLIPTHSDPESDLETQLAVLGAVIVGNLLHTGGRTGSGMTSSGVIAVTPP